MQRGMLAEPILVGREHELEQLTLYLDTTREGKGKTVFISGSAGSGKTRLAKEFLKIARGKGANILSGWCLSNAAIPYFPFIEAFGAHFQIKDSKERTVKSKMQTRNPKNQADQTLSSITEWLKGPKEIDGFREFNSAQKWKDSTFAAVSKTLLSLSIQKPTILFMEDLHWADSASLALLHYIARMVSSARILVVATFRNEELNVDTEGHQHPLVDLLCLMGRENLYDEVKLSDLRRTSIGEIAENMIGGNLDPEFIDKLAIESQGNPLFVVESMRMLSEHGSLFQEDNRWHLSIDELGIPTKIRDVILRRLGVLKSSYRRVLDVASVIGETFDADLLAAVLDQDPLEVLESLNSILKSTSLVVCQGDSYKFDHAKSREALYEEIPLPLKKGYHSRIAQKLETKRPEELQINDLAYHYTQSGNIPKSLKYSLAAGEDAIARFSNIEAIKLFKYVLNTVMETAEYTNERIAALEGLGDGFFAKGLFEEARKTFEELANTAPSGILKLRALRKATAAARWRGDCLHSLELAQKACEYAHFDQKEYARVLMNKGWASCLRGNAKEGLTDLEKALEIFEEEYALSDAAGALTQAASFGATVHEYPIEKSLRMGLRALAIYYDIKDLRGQVEASFFVGTVFNNCMLMNEAAQTYTQAIEIGEKIADFNHLAWLHLYLAILLESTDNFQTALPTAARGLEFAEKTDSFYIQSMLYSTLVRIAVKIGDLKNAEEFNRKLIDLLSEVDRVGSKLAIASGKRTEAIFLASKNQYEEANQQAEESLQMFKALHHTLFEAMLRVDYAWILNKQGKTEDAKVQSREAENLYGKLRQNFDNLRIEADIMVPRMGRVSKEFKIRLDLINISNKPGMLIRIDNLMPNDFTVAAAPTKLPIGNKSVELNGKELEPFNAASLEFTLKATKTGEFSWTPRVFYSNYMGKEETSSTKLVKTTICSENRENALPGRIPTGFVDLDEILLGGIPQEYAVILTAPSSDERTLLIERFLKAGADAGETTFYVTVEAGTAKTLAEKYPSNFYLALCNPRADTIIQNLPNVLKLKGTENLTEIDIALNKVFRTLNPFASGPRRACIEIVSDVLLQHHAITTRKWLSALLQDLKSRGFSTLAVIDPQMHPPEETQAILGLFEGEIRVTEKETAKGTEKVLKIRKLYNQKYLENELTLTKQVLST